jgi:hypothetical protein
MVGKIGQKLREAIAEKIADALEAIGALTRWLQLHRLARFV